VMAAVVVALTVAALAAPARPDQADRPAGDPGAGPAAGPGPAPRGHVPVPSVPADAMVITPGEDPQAAVDAAGPGATLRLAAGVHHGFAVRPLDFQRFVADPGAVLDGDGRAHHAFYAFGGPRPGTPPPGGVLISGAGPDDPLVIRGYAGPLQTGAIHPQVDTRPELGRAAGWTVQFCDVSGNAATGIRLGDDMTVVDNRIADNGQLGVGGSPRGATVARNEIAGNRTRPDVDPDWEGGGLKVVDARDVTVADNWVHDNGGAGVWADIDSVGTTVRDNRVEDNDGAGIFDEISYGALIERNTVTGNGRVDGGWVWGAGIQVAGSTDVVVRDNVLQGNRHGIVLVQQQRGSGAGGPHLVDRITVEGNRVRDSGISGAVRDTADDSLFRRELHFRANQYAGDRDRPFAWADRSLDWAGWQEQGHDPDGSFTAR
jgi:parallel beta-helix repeat protein